MAKRDPIVVCEFNTKECDNINVSHRIEFEIQRDPVREWERKFAEVSKKLPLHERNALKSVVAFLQEEGRRLTQTQLLDLANNRPGRELDEGPMKRVLAMAVKEGLLTKKGRKGYGLPFWDMQETA